MTIPHDPCNMQELSRIEALDKPTNDQLLSVLIDRGKFRLLSSSSDNPADQFLVYTPNTLPYNPSAPLRNTVPFIPLSFTDDGVKIDPVIPEQYINPSVKSFVSNTNRTLTRELREEQQLIRDQLGLDHIRSELNHIGSVIEDDALSLSSDAEEMMKEFSEEFNIPLPVGLPPRSLKEIYQLPHKGKNSRDEDETKDDKKNGGSDSQNDFDICKLLHVPSTAHLNDDEFMEEIGWSEEAADRAEMASKQILYPYTKYYFCSTKKSPFAYFNHLVKKNKSEKEEERKEGKLCRIDLPSHLILISERNSKQTCRNERNRE